MKDLSIKSRLLALVAALLILVVLAAVASVVRLKASNDVLATVYNDRVVPLRQLKSVSDGYGNGIVDTAVKVANWRDDAAGTAVASLKSAQATIAREWAAYLATYLERRRNGAGRPGASDVGARRCRRRAAGRAAARR